MSYHIYQTEGFIIDSKDIGEANRLVTLFTADLGLVNAAAQSVRVQHSKLKSSLQDLSFASLALVRGKELWRVTSARKLISLYDRRIPVGGRIMMARVLALVKRLVVGESPNPNLFSILSSLASFCFSERHLLKTKEASEAVELIASLRILAVLGYAAADETFHKYIVQKNKNIGDMNDGNKVEYEWSVELIEMMKSDSEQARKELVRAVRESHL
ncbi:MAG: DNA repair protein RecO [Patescibacteria group bacterium]